MARKRRGWDDLDDHWRSAMLAAPRLCAICTPINQQAGDTKRRWANGSSRTASRRSTRALAPGFWSAFSTAPKSTSGFRALTDSERFRFNHPNTVLSRWKGSTVVPDPNATPKPSPYAQLKDAHAQPIEENHRLQHKIEAADGDLWKPTDTAADIAEVMIATLSPAKAERTAREILKKLKERKAMRPSVEAGRVLTKSGFDTSPEQTQQPKGQSHGQTQRSVSIQIPESKLIWPASRSTSRSSAPDRRRSAAATMRTKKPSCISAAARSRCRST